MTLLKVSKIRNFVDTIFEYSFYLTVFFLPVAISLLEVFKSIFMISGLLKVSLDINLNAQIRDFSLKKFYTSFKDTLVLPSVLIFLAAALSILNTDYLNESIKGLFFKWGRNIVLYFLVFYFIKDRKSEKVTNLITTLNFISVLMIVDTILQFFTGIDPIRQNLLFKATRVNATFGINNNYAGWLITIIPVYLALSVLGDKIKVKSKVNYYLIASMLFVCLIFTYTRSALMAFIASIFILTIKKSWKFVLGFIVLLLIVIFLLPPDIRSYFMFVLGPLARIDIWHGALNMVSAHPVFGVGVNTFSVNYPLFRTVVGEDYAHNCYLQIWAETGIIGLFALLFLLFVFYKTGLKYFRVKKLDHTEIFGFGIFLGLNATLIHSFFDTNLYCLQLATFFWIMLGIYDGLRWKEIKSLK